MLNERLLDAVEAGYLEGVKKALEGGADANARGGLLRHTVWMMADDNGYIEIADELKKYGAIVTAERVGQMIPDSTVDQLCIKGLLQTSTVQPPSVHAPAGQTPVSIPEAQAQAGGMNEASDDAEAGIYRFGALRRTLGWMKEGLGELASDRKIILVAGLLAGIVTSNIAEKVGEHRTGKAAVAVLAPAQADDRWKDWAPAQEKQRQANDKQLIEAARKSDYESANLAIDNGVTWEALSEARRIAALNKNWRIVHLTSWVTSSTAAPDRKGPPMAKEKPEQAQPQDREHGDDERRFVSATSPDVSCTTHWGMNSVKLALKKSASQCALSHALWNVGDNRMNADEKQSTEVAYLIAQRMEPAVKPEPEAPAKAEPKKPEAKVPRAQHAPAPKAPGASLTPREKGRLLRELDRAVERGDEKAVERIMEKAGVDAKLNPGGPSS
jgi:hypothetical protein